MMHGRGKSDFAIVAVKLANKVERSAAELVEPRAETKGNVGQQSTRRTQSRISVSKALARIRQIVAVDTRGSGSGGHDSSGAWCGRPVTKWPPGRRSHKQYSIRSATDDSRLRGALANNRHSKLGGAN
jgi:hypothetical protein